MDSRPSTPEGSTVILKTTPFLAWKGNPYQGVDSNDLKEVWLELFNVCIANFKNNLKF